MSHNTLSTITSNSLNKIHLNIATYNINGNINNKINWLNSHCKQFNFDLLHLNETRLHKNKELRLLPLFKGYQCITIPGISVEKTIKWGSLLLIKDLIYHSISNINIWNDNRTIVITINLTKLGPLTSTMDILTIICVYAPSGSPNLKTKYLNSILNFINNLSNPFLIIGDFNIQYSIENQKIYSKNKVFKKILSKYANDTIAFNENNYTFFSGEKKTKIDHILTSPELINLITKSCIHPECLGLSPDHRMVSTQIVLPVTIDINNNTNNTNVLISKINSRAITPLIISNYKTSLKKLKCNSTNNIENFNNELELQLTETGKKDLPYKQYHTNHDYKHKLPKQLHNLQIEITRFVKAILTLKNIKLNAPWPIKIQKLKLNKVYTIDIDTLSPNLITDISTIKEVVTTLKRKYYKLYKEKLDQFYQNKIKKAITKATSNRIVSPKNSFKV